MLANFLLTLMIMNMVSVKCAIRIFSYVDMTQNEVELYLKYFKAQGPSRKETANSKGEIIERLRKGQFPRVGEV